MTALMVVIIVRKMENLVARMLRMMAYSMIALKMLKMQVTMYLPRWTCHT